MRVVRSWQRLPGEAVDASSLAVIQGQVECGLGQPVLLGGSPAPGRRLELDDH